MAELELHPLGRDFEGELASLGFRCPLDNLDGIRSLGLDFIERAGERGGPHKEPSGFQLSDLETTHLPRALVIDIGGTSSKISMREVSAQGQWWHPPLALPNDELNRGDDPDLFRRYASELFRRIAELGVPMTIDSLAIVWSNPASIQPLGEGELSSGAVGVTARVKDLDGAYRKGEFFIPALFEGRDIGATLLDAAASVGFRPRAFVIGNDTVLTLKSLPGAHAGVVASTGMNCTITDGEEICNSEFPALFRIPEVALGPVDRARVPEGESSLSLESVAGGMGFSATVKAYAHALGAGGVREFRLIARRMAEHKARFSNVDIGKLIQGDVDTLHELGLSARDVRPIGPLVEAVLTRAGTLAGLVPYVAAIERLSIGAPTTIALDCPFGQVFPTYRHALLSTVNELSEAIEIRSAPRHGAVTPPMIGAANAADTILTG